MSYEKIKADIYSRQKGHGPYDRVYTRNELTLRLIGQLQTDIVELKQNQAQMQRFLNAIAPVQIPPPANWASPFLYPQQVQSIK